MTTQWRDPKGPRQFVSDLFEMALGLVFMFFFALFLASPLIFILGWERAQVVLAIIAGLYAITALGRDSWTPWRREV